MEVFSGPLFCMSDCIIRFAQLPDQRANAQRPRCRGPRVGGPGDGGIARVSVPPQPGQPAHQREAGLLTSASGAPASGWYGAMTLPDEQGGMENFPSSELATQEAEHELATPPSSPPTPRSALHHGRGEAPPGAPGPGLHDRDGIELKHDILRIADVPVIFLSVYGQPGSAFSAAGRVLSPRRKSRRQPATPEFAGCAAGDTSGCPRGLELQKPLLWSFRR